MKRGLIFGLVLCLLATPVLAGSADQLLRKAEKGDPQAQFEMGRQAMSGYYPDVEQAEMWWLKAAEAGNAEAQYQLGTLYGGARLGPPNAEKALSWYEKAAAQGHTQAIGAVCQGYYERSDAAQDIAATAKACTRAATLDIPFGLAVMGEFYAQGTGGLPVDGAKAIDYLTRADSAGVLMATRTLGVVYFEGKLTAQDYQRSMTLFRRAMVKGDVDSTYWLGRQYEGGLGTAAEPDEAGRLYYLSGQGGNAAARSWLDAHSEITEDWLTQRRVSWFSDPRGTWTVTTKLPDGTTQETDVGDYLFGGLIADYPERALEDEVEGTVTVDCHWNNDGNVDNCLILTELPRGYGFGLATFKLLGRPVPLTQKADWARKAAGHNMRSTLKFVL